MKALSIKQPWLWAITDLDKNVENRTWKPPRWVIGQRIALHASKKDEERGDEAIFTISGGALPPLDVPRGAIVATAIVASYITEHEAKSLAHFDDKWFFGPVGWVFADVQKLEEPIPCRGALGLWDVPAEFLPTFISAEPPDKEAGV